MGVDGKGHFGQLIGSMQYFHTYVKSLQMTHQQSGQEPFFGLAEDVSTLCDAIIYVVFYNQDEHPASLFRIFSHDHFAKRFGKRHLHRRTVGSVFTSLWLYHWTILSHFGQGFQKNPLRSLGSNFDRCVLVTLKGFDGIGPFDGAKSFHLFVAQVNAVCNPWRKGASLSWAMTGWTVPRFPLKNQTHLLTQFLCFQTTNYIHP